MMKKSIKDIKIAVIIPSAGKGVRMGSTKKNFLPLAGRPVLAHTIGAFESVAAVGAIFLAVTPGDEQYCEKEIVGRYGFRKVRGIVHGGAQRQDSVANALRAAGESWDIIAIHDGARPLVTGEIIERTLAEAARTGAAVCAVPVKDTVKEVSGGFVKRTVPRENLWAVQTPQAFHAAILADAFKKAEETAYHGTDESSLVERIGAEVKIVEGSYENIKITTREDIIFAEEVLRSRHG